MTRTYIRTALAAITAVSVLSYGPLATGYGLAFAVMAAFVGVMSVRIRHATHGWCFNNGWSGRKVTRHTLPARGLQEALSEIKQVARGEPLLAADVTIALLERISPALEQVDRSSGAIGARSIA